MLKLLYLIRYLKSLAVFATFFVYGIIGNRVLSNGSKWTIQYINNDSNSTSRS